VSEFQDEEIIAGRSPLSRKNSLALPVKNARSFGGLRRLSTRKMGNSKPQVPNEINNFGLLRKQGQKLYPLWKYKSKDISYSSEFVAVP